MAFSRLQPDSATTVGLLTAAGVYLIYNNALPRVADIRTIESQNKDVDASRRMAAYKSAALIGIVFLVARDLNSYIISGAALIGIDLMYRHADAVNPQTGKVADSTNPTPSDMAYPPMPEYEISG